MELCNHKTKVSVICNAYNHEPYIEKTLNGFVMQKTNFPFEVIVHDDASTDNTAKIIRSYEKNYPNIIKPIYEKENMYSKGQGITYSISIPKSRGEYIAFCEGDDYWTDENKLQQQIDFLEHNKDYVACAHNCLMIDGVSGISRRLWSDCKNDFDMNMEDAIYNYWTRLYQTATLVFRRDALDEILGNGQKIRDISKKLRIGDHPLRIILLRMGKVRVFQKSMSVYRVESVGSWSSKLKKKSKLDYIKEKKIISKYFHAVDLYTEGKYHAVCQGKRCESLISLSVYCDNYNRYRNLLNIRAKYPFFTKISHSKHIIKMILPKYTFNMLKKRYMINKD